MPSPQSTSFEIRPARPADAEGISIIDAAHTGTAKPQHWHTLLDGDAEAWVAVRVDGSSKSDDADVLGFLLGEVRAWEFGSPPTGWVYAVGVADEFASSGVGRRLLQQAVTTFKARGAASVRTMVRRDNIALLRFFRGSGFSAGPFVELEIDCE